MPTSTITKNHSYEEIRSAVIEVLLDPRKQPQLTVYQNLVAEVAHTLTQRGAPTQVIPTTGMSGTFMNDHDSEIMREVFWDLFRQGILILGRNDANPTWPAFRLTEHAKATLSQASPFRFHNVHSYLKLVRAEAPDILPETEEYLSEAATTFYVECFLSSAVMLGVAAEIEFNRLLEAGTISTTHGLEFQRARQEFQAKRKIAKFQTILPKVPAPVRAAAGEDLETNFNYIQSVLRISRNDAGHALASKPLREQMYVYLQLFVPFIRCVTRLRKAL